MLKPNASIIKNVPMSDSGMAMTGISTERHEHASDSSRPSCVNSARMGA